MEKKSKFASTFADRVRDIVRKIPKGQTKTYKEVAVAAGAGRSPRGGGCDEK